MIGELDLREEEEDERAEVRDVEDVAQHELHSRDADELSVALEGRERQRLLAPLVLERELALLDLPLLDREVGTLKE